MKAIIIILIPILILITLGCEESNEDIIDDQDLLVVDDSAIPDSLRKVLWEEANRISIHNIYEYESVYMDSVSIPSDSAQVYYFALVNIFNATDLAARDSVFSLYPFHFFSDYELHTVLVEVDLNQTWIDALRLTGLSGIADFDELITCYELEFSELHYWDWSSSYSISMRSERMLNTSALAQEISALSVIQSCHPSGWMGDSDRLFGQRTESGILITFEQRWGDCPAGCINRHGWQFSVSFQGEVTYLGSYGAEL